LAFRWRGSCIGFEVSEGSMHVDPFVAVLILVLLAAALKSVPRRGEDGDAG